jgi:hypothetical protein
MRFIISLFLIIVGAAIVWRSEWLYREFGEIEWAERHLATEGGSRLFYKLVGLAVIFLGFFVLSGIWDLLLGGFVRLLGLTPPIEK